MLFILLIPVLIIVIYYYKRTVPEISKNRRHLLLVLRFTAIVILLILLFNPVISFSRSRSFYPEIVFLNDNSYSMSLTAGDKDKAELLNDYKNTLHKELAASNYEIKNFTFADGIEGERTSSNLSATLRDVSERVDLGNVKEIFLFSDGWLSDEQFDIVNRLNIPITTLHPSYETDEFDVGINRLIYNQTAYTEEETPILVDLFADNYTDGAEVRLFLNDTLISSKKAGFQESSIQQVSFDHKFNNAGLMTITVEVIADREGEINLGNNVYPGAIRVLDKRSGTYIITDRPVWDTRFINTAFTRDDRKDTKVFTVRDNKVYLGREQAEIQDIFPEHLQLLVVINNGSLRFNNEQVEMIERFVGNSGGLLFVGKPISALQNLIAATDSGIDRLFRTTISFTSAANKYQTFTGVNAAGIPPVDHYYVSPMLHPEILARFNNEEQSPAIIYSEYRQGRIIYFPFLNLWRWQLRTEGNRYFGFIDNLASWLANPAGIDFFAQSDKNSYFLGETVKINLTALDETLNIHSNLNPKLKLADENNETIREEFLLFDGQKYGLEIPGLESGNYSFEIEEETTGRSAKGDFIVSNIDAQSRNRGFNYPLLSYISRQTGGEILYDDDVPAYSSENAQRKTQQVRLAIPLYRHWLIITLFLTAFCLELYLRKRWGLL